MIKIINILIIEYYWWWLVIDYAVTEHLLPALWWTSAVVRSLLFCGHQSKPRLVTLSSLAWHIVCLENTDRQTGRHRATNIWGNKWGNYLLKRLHLGWPSHPGCVLVCNLWFWIRLRVMTVTWTNQMWQKIISWPSFDLQILKTGIISMLGARLVNR